MTESIIIIDFGSQVTKLIARRIREFGVFSQIVPFNKVTRKMLSNNSVKGIIFSGGPKSVHEKNSPKIDDYIYELEIPILGICYGLQLIAKQFGGNIIPATDREFGKRTFSRSGDFFFNLIFVLPNSLSFEGTIFPPNCFAINWSP